MLGEINKSKKNSSQNSLDSTKKSHDQVEHTECIWQTATFYVSEVDNTKKA